MFSAHIGCLLSSAGLYVCASAPACLYVTLYTRLSVCPHTSGWRAGLPASLGLLAVRPACRCVGVGLAVRRGARLGPPPPPLPASSGMTRAAARRC